MNPFEDPRARRLLEAFDEMTPPIHRRQRRDAVRAEDVGQRVGLCTVGRPDTGVAVVARLCKGLVEYGYLERAKDEEGDGPIKYRLTQLAERESLTARMSAYERELEVTRGIVEEERAARRHAQHDLFVALERLWDLEKPRWWQFWRRERDAKIAADED